MSKTIAVVGEYRGNSAPQAALNAALEDIRDTFGYPVDYEWVDTDEVESKGAALLKGYAGIWSAPGSPFRSLEGALAAISYARRNQVPHLGTCAGFQHTILEYARNVLDMPEAQHEEYHPDADVLFITRLACSLAGQELEILLEEGTLAFSCYGQRRVMESYYCNFGINPGFRDKLIHSGLRLSGRDKEGEVRIVELPGHPFFAATLFVPQTRSIREAPHPLILRFVQACAGQ